ncbi:MAG: DEAD/DEAH box helicase family protein [Clostridia bacterium]|nr:DEAD/DEAH box helicase family protein [Clostridia bacterium]
MSNFDFLLKNKIFESFASSCVDAEKALEINSVTSAILARRAVELAVKWMYANDEYLKLPYQDNVSALIHDITFKNIIDETIFEQIKYIIKLGNFAVHSNKKLTREEAILSLNYLFNFTQWIMYCYTYEEYIETEFNEGLLPSGKEVLVPVAEKENLYEELSKKDKKLEEIIRENEELRKQLTEKRKKKVVKDEFKIKDISEYDTRKKYIDLDLKLAGWDFSENMTAELPLSGMPNNADSGRADYVLFGKNGLPLAVVEAKRTSVDSKVGQHQAKLYADCLEKEYHQRPIIFYTNGYEIHMWDDMNYAPRKVWGFYTQDELQLLINRRTSRESLKHIVISDAITNRGYQHEAIRSVCEAFDEGHRKALLVMATGTGKTRTAISIVDVLTTKNWAKNVLFLADRKTLVKQAKNNFVKLLPNQSCCNLLNANDKENPEECRIVFSTYQTMMNEIDNRKGKNGNKLFTPGHFDLIIIDEAHRSIYKKYQAIFEYFDGLLVGLTATPRNDVDKNTYKFFEIENDVPTFAYELDEAVKEGYLVDYHCIRTGTEFMSRGIRYADLSEEEKEEYETLFEEYNTPDEIEASAMNSWIFNHNTIMQLLEILMEKGLKVEGGDKLGKTIIFAKNHRHAEKIVDVFNELYPNKNEGGHFIKLIDNQVKYNDNLIDDFTFKDLPVIAVSVDMLDTGVDVPEVLNLVFFKPVKSKIKFWQMIGRGTRLCKDLFGPGMDKKEFYIFDYCGNFDFFAANPKGTETANDAGLTEKIYNAKLDLIVEFQNMKYQDSDEYVNYRNSLIEDFQREIQRLNRDSFIVKAKTIYVEKYSKADSFNYISILDAKEIKDHITPLFYGNDEEECAKRFDSLLYGLQVSKINKKEDNRRISGIISLMEELQKLGTIPQVFAKKELILKASTSAFWKTSGFFEIEKARAELRELIQYIELYKRISLYTNFTDIVIPVQEGKVDVSYGSDFTNYRKKVNQYLAGNLESLIIYKIRHNQRLTEAEKKDLERIMFEELGTNKEYVEAFGNKHVMEVVRNMVGIAPETANEIFSKYINDNKLNLKQIKFVKLLIDYVIKNGTVEMEVLTEDPFRSLGEVYEVFENNIGVIKELRRDIEHLNDNAKLVG